MKKLLILTFICLVLFGSCKEHTTTPETPTLAEWEKVSDLPGYFFYSLKIKDNTIYMIYYNDGHKFACSKDSGKTWQVSELDFYVKDYCFLSVEGNKFYISGYDGLFESSDKGLTWSENLTLRNYVNPTISFQFLTDISINDNEIFVSQNANQYMAYYANGLIYSSDGGINWISPPSFPTHRVVALEKFDQVLVFCDYKIQYSFDNLNTWYFANGGEKEIVDFYKVDSKLFAVDYFSIKVSKNHGISWTECCPPLQNSEIILPNTFTSNANKIFVMSNEGVIFTSDQSEINWEILNNTIPVEGVGNSGTLFAFEDFIYLVDETKMWRKKITD
ncbi:MAG: glycoside hydrolase [Ignavibacterium sp.]|jgi:hypothetical protein|nr:glycoside hydrolase [Ignavibacterium sp.]